MAWKADEKDRMSQTDLGECCSGVLPAGSSGNRRRWKDRLFPLRAEIAYIERTNGIEIVRVVHGARDLDAVLQGE